MLAILALAGGLGCAVPAGAVHVNRSSPVEAPAAVLGEGSVPDMLLGADAARRRALALADPTGLEAWFGGRALAALRERTTREARRGARLEDEPDQRRVVHVRADRRQGEGVVALRGRARLLLPGRPEPPWTGSVRQWWARLAASAGGWRVVEEQDLPPERWWPG